MKKFQFAAAAAAIALAPLFVGAQSSTELSDADVAACNEVLAGWSDEKVMKTKTALEGSASYSNEVLEEKTAMLYEGASSDEQLMSFKCKSVLLNQMRDEKEAMMKKEAMMAPEGLSEEDIAACKEVLAGWSDDKMMKTKAALQGSASYSNEVLEEKTAMLYEGAADDKALMGLKCKSVLLMEIKEAG